MQKIILKFQMDATRERDAAVTRATALTWPAEAEEGRKVSLCRSAGRLLCVPRLLAGPEAPRLTCGLCKVHTSSRDPEQGEDGLIVVFPHRSVCV